MLAINQQQDFTVDLWQPVYGASYGGSKLFAFEGLVGQIMPVGKLAGHSIGLIHVIDFVNRFVELPPKVATMHPGFIDNYLKQPSAKPSPIFKL